MILKADSKEPHYTSALLLSSQGLSTDHGTSTSTETALLLLSTSLQLEIVMLLLSL